MMSQTIKLGLPTLIEFETIEDCAKLCQESNLDFIEILQQKDKNQMMVFLKETESI